MSVTAVTPERDASRDDRHAEVSLVVTPAERAAIRLVFDGWQQDTGHYRAILDRKRARRILARLREGFTPARLLLAITHRRNDTWLMGQGDSPRVYDDVDVLLRDAAQVERLERLTEPETLVRSKNAPAGLLARARRIEEQELADAFDSQAEPA